MAVALTILPEHQLCLLCFSGAVTPADFDDVWKKLSSATERRADFDELVFIGADVLHSSIEYQLTKAEAARFVQAYQRTPEFQPKRIAFICATEMQRAFIRMFGAYVEACGPCNAAIAAVASLGEAIGWVEPSKGPTRKLDRAEIADLVRQMGQGWCLKDSAAA